MCEVTCVISDEAGLHARPAGLLVKVTQKYKSNIVLKSGEKSCNAKKIFSVMGLAVKKGDTVTFAIEGEDEAAAEGGLKAFVNENL
jgi:phosphocarrier protein